MAHRLIPARDSVRARAGRVLSVTALPLLILTATLAPGCGASPAAPAPRVPTPLAPAANATMPNGCFDFSRERVWDFDWTDVPRASAYQLHVASGVALTPMIDRQDITASSFRHSSTGWTGTLSGWEWRVRARVDGFFGDWSPTITFGVEPPNVGCE